MIPALATWGWVIIVVGLLLAPFLDDLWQGTLGWERKQRKRDLERNAKLTSEREALKAQAKARYSLPVSARDKRRWK